MNWFDKNLIAVFPGWASRRLRNKMIANAIVSSYEAIKPSRFRKKRQTHTSAEVSAGESTEGLRGLARELDENDDTASGILDTLVDSIIGSGISIEPQAKDLDGNLLPGVNKQISDLLADWMEYPEVTGEQRYYGAQRLACRSWMRDGEMFTQKLSGNIRGLEHNTKVPFSIELMESDLVPTDLEDENKNIRYGIRRNAWGKALVFYFYKKHPGDNNQFSLTTFRDYKSIAANKIIHLKNVKRIRQGRGITVFATVFNRLDDIRDFEESERIAARIAAAQVMAITKPLEALGSTNPGEREFPVSPGTVWDNLQAGEEPKILSSDRPNNNLEAFRNGQLKPVAAGTGTGHSSISKTYDGSYAAQRQELVEQTGHYEVLQDFFIANWCKPIHKELLRMARLTPGVLKLPKNIDLETLHNADYIAPVIPWIDPEKAVNAEIKSINSRIKSQSQVIRERGGNPQLVREQIAKDIEADEKLGLPPIQPDTMINNKQMNPPVETV